MGRFPLFAGSTDFSSSKLRGLLPLGSMPNGEAGVQSRIGDRKGEN